jgi:hypothetical protein
MIKKAAKRAASLFILIEKTDKGFRFRFTWWFWIVFVASLIVMSKFGVFINIANAVSKIIRG